MGVTMATKRAENSNDCYVEFVDVSFFYLSSCICLSLISSISTI